MTKTREKETNTVANAPFSLDDLTRIETHDILVERSDLKVTAQHETTLKKIYDALTLEKGQYYLKLPKLYTLSVGENEDIGKITVNRTKYTINFQSLISKIANQTRLQPKLVRAMVVEAWKYEEKYPILKQNKEEIIDSLTLLQSTEQSQAEVTILLKSRLIPEWNSIDTERLGQSLFNKIYEYVLLDANAWENLTKTEFTPEEQAILDSAATSTNLALEGGKEQDDPTPALNPSTEISNDSEQVLTLETNAQAS